eukprot:gene40378-53375_t
MTTTKNDGTGESVDSQNVNSHSSGFGMAAGVAGKDAITVSLPPPEYDTFDAMAFSSSGYRIKVVRDFEDMAKVFAIRGSAYFSDAEHVYAKHFDGNDFSSTHLIGFVDGEPVATVRIRYFSDFTRIERLAVRPTHRKSRISFKLAKAAFAFCRDKGYKRLSGVAREELVPFWSMLGFRIDASKTPIYIYGLPHYEMRLDYAETPNAVTAETHPLILLRPEGRWNQAGHHETINPTTPSEETRHAGATVATGHASKPRDVATRLSARKTRLPGKQPRAIMRDGAERPIRD